MAITKKSEKKEQHNVWINTFSEAGVLESEVTLIKHDVAASYRGTNNDFNVHTLFDDGKVPASIEITGVSKTFDPNNPAPINPLITNGSIITITREGNFQNTLFLNNTSLSSLTGFLTEVIEVANLFYDEYFPAV